MLSQIKILWGTNKIWNLHKITWFKLKFQDRIPTKVDKLDLLVHLLRDPPLLVRDLVKTIPKTGPNTVKKLFKYL